MEPMGASLHALFLWRATHRAKNNENQLMRHHEAIAGRHIRLELKPGPTFRFFFFFVGCEGVYVKQESPS